MRVLLTGAFGNIGSSAILELVAQGHSVRCFDVPSVANRKAALVLPGGVDVVWGDMRSYGDVARAVRDQDIVVHLAFIIPKLSATGIGTEDRPDWSRSVNVGGTQNVIAAMRAQPQPPRLVFSSSYHVYGPTYNLSGTRRASDPVYATDHYTSHKIECERLVKTSGLEWAILRFAAALPLAIKLDRAMFDIPLNNRMEFVHTRDVGLAVANAVSSPEVWGKTLLIGGGPRCQYYYGEIVRSTLEALGVGMLPASAFGTTPFCTDWMDTAESESLLHFQRRTLDDWVKDMRGVVGLRRHLIRLFRPSVRSWLLSRSPYYAASLGTRGSWKHIAGLTWRAWFWHTNPRPGHP